MIVPEDFCNKRLDQILSIFFPQYSRTTLQKWIKQGCCSVDGDPITSSKEKISGGAEINLHIPETPPCLTDTPAEIDLDICYEDSALIVLNKPPGLVVHPGAGNPNQTLLNALLHHYPAAATLPRAGIVHRLDKDTSGLMVIAKTLSAQTHLVQQLQSHLVKREYVALVWGHLIAGVTVEAPIARHPKQRTKMAVCPEGYGKPAVTHVRIMKQFGSFTGVHVQLETGRTHQIRVHLAHLGYPVVGDPLYAGRLMLPKGCSEALTQALRSFKRQALHAQRLSFAHPITGEPLQWSANIPVDMQHLYTLLETSR